ncbi:unnamed protein product [Cuscuta campestris]|uniref:Uncharacterized protein n=1 Tax=Cuscuta campestris TaxID=132261 RepID=A0A484L983_9ASTE|nr:unnamed protein product [Cuscuta campestris]
MYNHTTLAQENTKTLHAIIHNWCKFVMTQIFGAITNDKPLPYALLVMAILDEYNMKTDVGPKQKGTKYWEIDESSFHSGIEDVPFPPSRPCRKALAPSLNLESLSE